jgi:hypothetical protein
MTDHRPGITTIISSGQGEDVELGGAVGGEKVADLGQH